MPRRPHRKSRNGCVECKRRHIKCDEKTPICSNCTTSERACEYAVENGSGLAVRQRKQASASRSPSSQPSQPQSSVAGASTQQELDSEYPPVNIHHFDLLYHLTTEVFESLRPEFEGIYIPHTILFKVAVSSPYLMNALLALSAIHRSTLNQQDQNFYLHEATELQTRALSIFNAMKPEVNSESCVPIFLFSSILGLHEMCKIFVFREPNFEPFMEKFVRYLSLHRGVRVVSTGLWHILKGSILAPVLERAESALPNDGSLGEICLRLQNLIHSSNLPAEDATSCEEAITSLQSVLGATTSDTQVRPQIQTILAWPVILSQGYTDLLRRREPHSLVILAHFGAAVHSRRDIWVWGDGGAFLVNLISQHLGNAWLDCLAWPLQAISY
ncbi:hypothetical protein N7528_003185 [Penicillium herquei]|nr:hypothetical protein N7528_003185 [Penicillium herquei]